MFEMTGCSVCLSVDKRTVNINGTNVQNVYEYLSNCKVETQSYFLCHVCYRRLQQCHLIIKQAVNIRNTQTNCSQPPKSIVHLTTHNIENETIPYLVVVAKREPQEFDDQERAFERDVIVKREEESYQSAEDVSNSSKLDENNEIASKTKRTRIKRKKNPDKGTALCKVCNKTFVNVYSLATHKRTHTGEKPYTCDICNKKFTLSYSLNVHKRIHTGDKPYSCETCKKTFISSGYLIKHERIHTGEKPYACDLCDMRFRQKNCLTRHKRQHTGEKPYKCEICDKKLSDSSGFARHMKSHLNVKSYTCDVCDKKFLRSYTLTEHKKIHNKQYKM